MNPYQSLFLSILLLLPLSLWAQTTNASLVAPVRTSETAGTLDRSITRFEIDFKKPPVLEVELTDYISSDVKSPTHFMRFGRLIYPLKTDEGEVIVPAETLVTMMVSVKPGRRIGAPGEMVFTLEPILLAAGKESGRCLPETEIEDPAQFRQQLCQSRWRMVFSHKLHHLAVPEAGGAKILVVNPKGESVHGYSSSRPQPMYDPSGERTLSAVQTAANRSLLGGVVFDIGAATAGMFRLLFSKRNLYLPTTTRLWFQLDPTIKLIRATNTESRIRVYRSASSAQITTAPQRLSVSH
jgi:hypothetical protein